MSHFSLAVPVISKDKGTLACTFRYFCNAVFRVFNLCGIAVFVTDFCKETSLIKNHLVIFLILDHVPDVGRRIQFQGKVFCRLVHPFFLLCIMIEIMDRSVSFCMLIVIRSCNIYFFDRLMEA